MNNNQQYISNELIHFIGRGLQDEEQYAVLTEILRSTALTHKPHNKGHILVDGCLGININANIGENGMFSPDVICFCDIPFNCLSIHIKKYSSFGISFKKDFIAQKGGAPVHYIPKSTKVNTRKNISAEESNSLFNELRANKLSTESIDKADYFNQMLVKYDKLFSIPYLRKLMDIDNDEIPMAHNDFMEIYNFLNFHIFSSIKFFDHNLSDNDESNYYFEREWRIVGNLYFEVNDVENIFIPTSYLSRFQNDFPIYESKLHLL